MPRLVFDFPDPHSPTASQRSTESQRSMTRPASHRALFRDPVEVVLAGRIEDVQPAVCRVQEAVAGGLHAAGYISYEAAPAFEPAMTVRPGARLPLVWFGLFTEPEMVEGDRTGSRPGWRPGWRSGWRPDLRFDPHPDARNRTAESLEWRMEWGGEEHAAAVRDARAAIAAGRTYQVNLTTRMRALMDADPWALYERMRCSQGSGYHAFLDLGRHLVLSASPELFFRVAGREIVTRPMKGTRPRGRWPEEDGELEADLRSSAKDRAENLMIVDLLRNDLGRICETGSVRVTELGRIERYRTVLQMTSAVEGRLCSGAGLPEQLGSLFPCGSVTGAPKISTMREIARLESSPREIYCGAIGWIRPGGDSTFSVAIRTAWVDRERRVIEYGTGGGVVWDSTAEAELEELRAKTVVIREPWPRFALLETLALRNGHFTRRDRHLARMRDSAEHFGFHFPAADIEATLDDLASGHSRGAFLARVTLDDEGTVSGAARPLGPPTPTPYATPPRIQLGATTVDSASRFLFHKTTYRKVYDEAWSHAPEGTFDILLHNERGEVTELTRGNLVAEVNGERVTPTRASGLLAGCLRQELLDEGAIVERVILVPELRRATRLWFINSARGWIEVELG